MIRVWDRTAAPPEGVEEIPGVLQYLLAIHLGDEQANATSVDLQVLSDAAITVLNSEYRGSDCPTDVLAFEDGLEEEDGTVHLGDIAISAQTAEREAATRSLPVREEILLYAVHGALHLLGYDDEAPEPARRMRRAECEVLARWGIRPQGRDAQEPC